MSREWKDDIFINEKMIYLYRGIFIVVNKNEIVS